MLKTRRPVLVTAGILCLTATSIFGQGARTVTAPDRPVAPAYTRPTPTAFARSARPQGQVARLDLPALDRAALAREDARRDAVGQPFRFAIPHRVRITPATHGTHETLADGTRIWRLRVRAPGATSLNFGFAEFALPPKARLLVYSADREHRLRPFTQADNRESGELWTPIMPAAEVVLELTMPKRGPAPTLTLVHVGQGYRGFPRGGTASPAGTCDIDVACPQGLPWRAEIRSVAVFSLGGSLACTGFMVNNTSQNQRPFFMTADHCGVSASNAASLVVYWNYETAQCGGQRNGSLKDFQTGATFRAGYGLSDFTLVELSAAPNPAWDVHYAGWDRTGRTTTGAVAIHHPDTKEKSISFENDPTSIASYLGNISPGDGSHIRVADWDVGSTEPGSSGSPLFDPAHRVIGQLHGGRAACGNNLPDWYGRFSVSWTGGGTASTRLSDWLDPSNTGATTLDTLGPALSITPPAVSHRGPFGGPFTNPSTPVRLTNRSNRAITYAVSVPATGFVLIDGARSPIAGTLAANGGTVVLRMDLDPTVPQRQPGVYRTDVTVQDVTNTVTSVVQHTLEIGRTRVFSFDFDTNPGWTKEGNWNFGRPLGLGGANHGNPDPRSGRTGADVWGFNLQGDYKALLPVRRLTSKAIDCRGLAGVRVGYWRWLNVEEQPYDFARFQVSKDGANFVTIWENGSSEITDNDWVRQQFDISAIADGEATVYLRWTMGVTDDSWEYSGWNIDDVTIDAIPLGYFGTFGAGCAGTFGQPGLRGEGLPRPGGTIELTIDQGAASGTGWLFLAVAPDRPGTGCIHLQAPFLGPVVLPLNALGTASLQATIPTSTPVGLHVYLQALVFSGSDVGATNGLDVLIK